MKTEHYFKEFYMTKIFWEWDILQLGFKIFMISYEFTCQRTFHGNPFLIKEIH